jgi:hypothetical protein
VIVGSAEEITVGRRRDARNRALEIQRDERRWVLRAIAVVALILVSGFTKGWWARGFDHLIGWMGDGSTAAAFVGWLAGFGVVIYVLVIIATKHRRPDALRRTWVIGALLFMPFLTLQPSRYTRSADIQDRYWYLGSFFDTYSVAIFTILGAAAVGALGLWAQTRSDENGDGRSSWRMALGSRAAVAVLAAGTLGTLVWALVGF